MVDVDAAENTAEASGTAPVLRVAGLVRTLCGRDNIPPSHSATGSGVMPHIVDQRRLAGTVGFAVIVTKFTRVHRSLDR